MKTSSFLGGLLLAGVFTAGCGDDSGGGGGAGGDATTSSTTGATTGGTTSSTTAGSTSASTTSSSTGGGGATSSSSGDGGATSSSSSSGDGGAGGATTATSTGTGGSASVSLVDCGSVDPVVTIATLGLAFDPALVTIAPGDVVRFTPGGFHDMTADDASWATPNPGDTACLQFNEAGLFPFHCSVHPASMTGTVTVE